MCFWMILLKELRLVKSELWFHFLKISLIVGYQVYAWGHRTIIILRHHSMFCFILEVKLHLYIDKRPLLLQFNSIYISKRVTINANSLQCPFVCFLHSGASHNPLIVVGV